ncbi:MAG: hypothetical protein R3260_16720 [Pseudomonas sp.]|nr:hypothetical protein [Pseudomonas sp.]
MKLKTWMLASLLLPAMPVGASSLFQPIEITDAEMSTLRGRYILPEGIVHFGVTMSTSWRNSSGATIGAQVNLTVNNLSANLSVTPLDTAGNGSLPGQGQGQVIGGQGLNNVQGISQSVRTAGDYNNGENYVDVNITRSSGQPISTTGQSWGGNQQYSNAAGTVQVSSANGGLQMQLQASQGQGAASNSIGRGGLNQQANIGGTFNQVRNLTSLTVAMQENPTAQQRVYCNLTQLGVSPRAGY